MLITETDSKYTNKVMNNLENDGAHIFGEVLDPKQAASLYHKIIKRRHFGAGLFLSEENYLAQENNLKANPSVSFNFLNEFTNDLDFVEKDHCLQHVISEALGEDYEVVIKKLICGVPFEWLPEWVVEKVKDVNVANLGPYIKPEYRDITYFRGIDFHQDIIDWPKGKSEHDPSTFITLYVYLHEVTKKDSPLHLLPKSHKLGATMFPHDLFVNNDNQWVYSDGGRAIICKNMELTGGAGYAAIWHNCTLHGTSPIKGETDEMRLSLRYLMAKSKKNTNKEGIDLLNEKIDGELNPEVTRRDLDLKGRASIKGNIINMHYEE